VFYFGEKGAPPAEEGGAPDSTLCLEANTATDPKNCGACGHDCLGGGCDGGACQPFPIVANITGDLLVLSDGVLYFDSRSYAGAGGGFVGYISTDAGPIADGAVASDGAASYTTLATADLTDSIAVGGGRMVWVTDLYVLSSIPVDGGTVSTLTALDNNTISGLSATATQAFYSQAYKDEAGTTTKSIESVPLRGGKPTTLASVSVPAAVATDSTYVYYTDVEVDAAPPAGRLYRRKHDGTDPASIATGGFSQSSNLLSDGARVYWSERYGSLGIVSLDGGTVTTLASPEGGAAAIAFDRNFVYFTVNSAGTVDRVPIAGDGGTSLVALSAGRRPVGIAVDDHAIYWSDFNTSSIYKLAK
jgi:hypothetical protein